MKSGQPIPENELWLHSPEVSKKLDRALAWAREHPPSETDLEDLEERILRGESADKSGGLTYSSPKDS